MGNLKRKKRRRKTEEKREKKTPKLKIQNTWISILGFTSNWFHFIVHSFIRLSFAFPDRTASSVG
jgi:hypothetical protein